MISVLTRRHAATCLLLGAAMLTAPGCGGNDFLGLEDYQRDFLGAIAGALLAQEIAGDATGQPVPGADGADCWDLNGNGEGDLDEDLNGDGAFDALDCVGAGGEPGSPGPSGTSGADGLNCWDVNANGIADEQEDVNGDGIFDALDCRGSVGADGASGSSGSSGSSGASGPSFFDIFIDDFFGLNDRFDGTSAEVVGVNPNLTVDVVTIDEPILDSPGQSAFAYRVAIPDSYQAGNDVTMRMFFFRTGGFTGDCFIFTVDARHLRAGTGVDAYDDCEAQRSAACGRRWVRVDTEILPTGMTAGDIEDTGVLVVVDLPLNSMVGLDLDRNARLAGGDFLAFEVARYEFHDGRRYQILGVEFFESASGTAGTEGATVFFDGQPTATCLIDCNENGIPDEDDRANCPDDDPSCQDCNENGRPDECDLCDFGGDVAAGASLPFTFLQSGFTQELYASAPGFMGGVAFAPDGDVLVDACPGPSTDFAGSALRRFDAQTTEVVHGSTIHPLIDTLDSNAGCGLTNHVDGTLYSNTGLGVTNLDAETGTELRDPFGPAGKGLGITPDPLNGNLVYVGADGTIWTVNAGFTASSVFSNATTGEANLKLDGIAFDPSGQFLMLAGSDLRPDSPDITRKDPELIVLRRDGSLVQRIPIIHDGGPHDPDGIAFHASSPKFLVTVNLDGTISRFDFPDGDFTQTPTLSIFASGGFRGDLIQVGGDGCIFLTQNQTRFADGMVTPDLINSIVRVCGGFAPPVPSVVGLTPPAAFNFVGSEHTVTAAVNIEGVPASGVEVTFEVLLGPNAGTVGTGVTDGNGLATFTYIGTGGVGTDEIQASFVEEEETQLSNVASKTWFPDDCSLDCNENGVPDDCELDGHDCNGNGIHDACDVECPD